MTTECMERTDEIVVQDLVYDDLDRAPDEDIEILAPTWDKETMSALVIGDTHGNLWEWSRRIVPTIRKTRPDVLLQVGDFGYGWDEHYLPALDEILEDAQAPDVIWFDGNHENFDLLEAVGAFGATEPFRTSRKTWYLPRGFVWEWQGRRCMAVGGAYSVDKPHRRAHTSWWEQEELTDADVARGQLAGHVDVVFAHDSFAGFKVPGPHAAFKQAGEFDRLSLPNRLKVLDIVKSAKPQLFIHGHYHYGYEQTARAGDHEVNVIGLARDETPDNMLLLEFPSLVATRL